MNINVYKVITGKMPEMSKAQVKIAHFILGNPNQIPFLTVGKLAKIVNVSDATVVRFATFLGFSGYPEFQRHIQSSVQQQLTATERLKLSKEVYGQEDQGISHIIGGDIENIQLTLKNLDVENFRNMVASLLEASRVYIVANRSAGALGVFLHYYLNMILDHVELLDSIEKNADRLHDLGEDDFVLGISFSRYTKSTVDILRFANEKNAKTAALTDNLLSPLIQHADISLTAESNMPAFIDSFTAPLSVINALIIYAAKQKQDGFEKRLDELEEVWERFDVFH